MRPNTEHAIRRLERYHVGIPDACSNWRSFMALRWLP